MEPAYPSLVVPTSGIEAPGAENKLLELVISAMREFNLSDDTMNAFKVDVFNMCLRNKFNYDTIHFAVCRWVTITG